jgi:hypothetical protein
MNIGIVTSFTIGSLILLSILTLNMNMMLHSAESTVEVMTEYQHDAMFEMITHDISRIGYGFPTGSESVEIKEFNDHKIKFAADVLENGVHTITWEFTDTEASETLNPHDKVLKRIGTMGSGTPADLESRYHVIDFKITAFRDTYGKVKTSTPGQIQSLLVEITYEPQMPSNMRNNGMNTYQRKYWRKLIVPKNLQFN